MYGESSYPHYLSSVYCTGREPTLLQCPASGWGTISTNARCELGHAAAVRCYYNGKQMTR